MHLEIPHIHPPSLSSHMPNTHPISTTASLALTFSLSVCEKPHWLFSVCTHAGTYKKTQSDYAHTNWTDHTPACMHTSTCGKHTHSHTHTWATLDSVGGGELARFHLFKQCGDIQRDGGEWCCLIGALKRETKELGTWWRWTMVVPSPPF